MKIVEKCKGLPLAILVIARMLAGEKRSTAIWNRTLADVSVPLEKNKVCFAILGLSYRYLPLNLTPCFLYFAVFPEDSDISVRSLIALWLAEGFIEPSGNLPPEQVAESYLDQLIDRNLVQAGKRRTIDDGLKTCRIHDLVRELCIDKAMHENFMSIPSRKGSTSLINNIKPRRLSIQQQGTTPLSNWDPSSVRSFINFNLHFSSLACCKTISSSKYKLLRVLDLGESHGIQSDDFSNLVNLRYLRLFLSSKSSIPESLFELWNLQMLFLEGDISYNISLRSLLKLQHLQQLVIGKGGKGHKFSGYRKALLSKKQLHSLEVLSTTYPSKDFENAVKDGLCPNIKKLALCGVEGGWSLQTYLARLNYLQVLKISFSNSKDDIFSGVRDFDLPKNLTKITLKSSTWSDASMNMLGKFPELTTLKLVNLNHANLIAPEGSFLKLNTLHLDTIRGGEVRFFKTNTVPEHLYVTKCCCDFDKHIFLLRGLEDINIVSPNPRLELLIQRLQQEKSIRCRLKMH
ncbi:putative late blight resistance protein homolog R1B-16 [Chenopodium quinoa]|uniref:putative late blight resistance protein homolog R1B-16 n=1 Tax=Chenopodium quinoa TaxID=63459 RepID=UPI000B79A171|nr:putative late blight resistance protein homolog R1B-16 [Chenopodium quinoa]